MVKEPIVSVIIAAYRAPDYLRQAIESVERQTFRDYEIIVADDCSGEEYTSQYYLPEGVKLICRKERYGAAAATRNTGIRAARGKYVAFLDQDDVWLPEKLAIQVQALENNPKAGLVFCHYRAVDESLQPVGGESKARRMLVNPLKSLIKGCFIRTPSAVVIRRDVLMECGMMDESVVGASDWDLYLRVARDYPFIAIPEPLVLYRMHPEQLHKRKPLMRKATMVILDKTLDWARNERPGLVNFVRRSYCKELRHIAMNQIKEDGDLQAAMDTLKRATRVWPWNLRTYYLHTRIALAAYKREHKEE